MYSFSQLNQSQDIPEGIFIILPTLIPRNRERNSLPIDREYRSDTGFPHIANPLHIRSNATNNSNYRNMMLAGTPSHAVDRFSLNTLAVQSPLSGKDKVTVIQQIIKLDQIQHGFNTGFQLRTEKRQHSCSESSCSTSSRHICNSTPQLTLDHTVKRNQLSVEKRNHLLIRTFLRSIYICCTVWAM